MKIKFCDSRVVIDRGIGGRLVLDVCEYSALYQAMRRKDVKQCIVTYLEDREDDNIFLMSVDEIISDDGLMDTMVEDILQGEQMDRDDDYIGRVLCTFIGVSDKC